MEDRRNDIGLKVVVGLMSSVILIFIGLFVNAAWATAHDGSIKASDAQMRVAVLEAQFTSFRSDLTEIKDLLRRGIPRGNGGSQ
jgi:hypothetical protein